MAIVQPRTALNKLFSALCFSSLSIAEYNRLPIGADMINIGQFWLSSKKYGLLNMVSSAVIWSLWKLRNDLCFQRVGWKSMDVLLFKIHGLLQNWKILCPVEKEILDGYLKDIKSTARQVSWLPFVNKADV